MNEQEPKPPANDRLIRTWAPALGLTLTAAFGLGYLAGLTRDVPPGLAGLIVALLGGAAIPRRPA